MILQDFTKDCCAMIGNDNQELEIQLQDVRLKANLAVPENANGMVVFAHGSGSSRLSPRNTMVARHLQQNHFGTLLFDLLTEEEDSVYENRFDIDLLVQRLIAVTYWLQQQEITTGLPIGYFGASTGAAAALGAAAIIKNINAVVSRGGRPDLAMNALSKVEAATLLIIGGLDYEVIELNKKAFDQLSSVKEMQIVGGATHLFEEPGTMDEVIALATGWFEKYLQPIKQEGDV